MTENQSAPHEDDYADAPPDAAEPIAIIGLSCRLPGAKDAAQYWRNLADGVESIVLTSLEEQAERGVPPQVLADPDFVPATAIFADYDYFDASFFGMSIREAELRDPQHRLLLELAHTALEDAGYDPFRHQGDIGVYAGGGENAWDWHNTRRNPRIFAMAGVLATAISSHGDFMSTLVSYKLNLRGPSLTVNTACSTSLVALHLAAEALRNGECDMALAGGVSIDLPPGLGYTAEDGFYSSDGHCRAFDAKGTGTLWGNGGGLVVLKRLSDARADGDHIRALVLGNAINNDGSTKVGFTAPSQDGQAAVVAQALGSAGVDARSIGYVEAHGTGTALGDPIEVAALTSAFQRHSADRGWCALGSVKTNIGHLGHASGVAGVIKTVLAMEHELIPPTLHFESPNPKIDFESGPFYVAAAPSAWKADGRPRRAGVSSFGMGGTNAHVVLQEAPARREPARPARRPVHLLQLSAHTETALATTTSRLAAHLAHGTAEDPALPRDLADVAFTLRVGRRELKHRVAVVAADPADAAEALADPRRRILRRGTAVPHLAFMFPGQGAQYAGMGADLYAHEPVFRAVVDECCDLLAPELGEDLRTVMFAAGDEAAEERLGQTGLTQPALFVLEYALARLWLSWGVEPAGMVGHSIGEYVASTLAGVFDLPRALRVVAARGRMMQALAPGAMLAVQLDEAEVRALLPDEVSVAAVNGPAACVVSGPRQAVDEFAERLKAAGTGCRPLRTSHAFHSPMMEPVLAEFAAVVAEAAPRAPRLPFLSNVTGRWITAQEAADPAYWARHLREAVRFGDCLAALVGEGDWLMIECGPGRQLGGLVRLQRRGDAVGALTSLPHRGERRGDLEALYTAAGKVWTCGIALDPEAFGESGGRVPLPTYPYERKYCWIKPELKFAGEVPSILLKEMGRRPMEHWFALPAWRQLPPARPGAAPGRVLLFGDEDAQPLADALAAAGSEIIRVRTGTGFDLDDEGGYRLRPEERADYDQLTADLARDGGGGVPARIVHAFALTPGEAGTAHAGWAQQDRGFYSLLFLVQALAGAEPDEDAALHLDVVTAGTADVTGSDLLRPEHATVAGVVKVAPLELPWLTARQIDVEPGPGLRDLVEELCAEPLEDPVVALRAGRRWQRTYEDVEVPEDQGALPAGPGLRENGVYVITGGLGGIGITVAEDLAEGFHARLALVTRSGLPPREEWDAYLAVHAVADRVGRGIAAVRRMEQAGAQVLVLAADVADAASMAQVRDAVLERFGTVDGLIHAAGVPGGGMAEVKERAAADQVMRPKIAGVLALREAFGPEALAGRTLDFVALTSSVYAVSGEFGQVDYCGANNFMDAFARGGGLGWGAPLISVNWGSWTEVGMSAEVAAPAAFRALQRGESMTPVAHPVLTRKYAGEEGAGWCSGVISSATHWLLNDHRIAKVPVVPGTGMIELARAALVEFLPAPSPRHAVELRDVVFVEPLSVPDGTSAEVRVLMTPGAEGMDFQVVSISGGLNRVHAEGAVGWVEPGEGAAADLAAIRERCSLQRREGQDAYVSAGLLTFGPHWGNLRRVDEGGDEEIAYFDASGPNSQDAADWGLNPALLDEATGFVRTSEDGRFLPIGYGRLLARAPIPTRFHSHARHRLGATDEINTHDVTVYDEAGREVLSVSEYTQRRVDVDALSVSIAAAGAGPETAGGGQTLTGGALSLGIAPPEGAQAFRRTLGARLGAQIVVSVRPIAEIIASGREFTHSTVQEGLGAGTAGSSAGGAEEVLASAGYEAPRNDLEAAIARIWGDLLGVGRVGASDDFFEIGGNSLIAVQLITLIRKELGVRLPMRAVFDSPTVAGAAALIGRQRAAARPGDTPTAGPVLQRVPRQGEPERSA